MSKIARSTEPLYQTRGRPVSQAFEHRQGDGSPTDLTGCTGVAALAWSGVTRPLTIGPFDASGDFVVSGSIDLTADLPLGRVSELQIAITDSQGVVTDIVYPVIGETP